MKSAAAALCLVAGAAFAHPDHSPYDAPGALWKLIEMDGKPFTANVLLEFPQIGRIQGTAPCNRFQAEMWAAYPWFQVENIAATRCACPDLAEETRFFGALRAMSFAESADGFLILTGEKDGSMVFTPALSAE